MSSFFSFSDAPEKAKFHFHMTDGTGDILFQTTAPGLIVSYMDFSSSECPYGLPSDTDWSGWIAIHTCIDGRCELSLPGQHTAILKSGDCCIMNCTMLPSSFHFPLGHYTGASVLIRMDILTSSFFAPLKESAFPLNAWLLELETGPATFHDADDFQNRLLALLDHHTRSDAFAAKLMLMDLLHTIDMHGLSTESQTACQTQEQVSIARDTYLMLTEDPGRPYNLKEVAAKFNVSLSTLNNYFRAVYGEYIPAFIRLCRLDMAADLLKTTRIPVYEIAAKAGYANPSKFGSAFRKVYGVTPNEYRNAK